MEHASARRFWAMAAVVVLLAAQAHICLDSSQAQPTGHFCVFCHSGAWAIVSAAPALAFSFHIVRFQPELAHVNAKDARAEANSPRAPPQA